MKSTSFSLSSVRDSGLEKKLCGSKKEHFRRCCNQTVVVVFILGVLY